MTNSIAQLCPYEGGSAVYTARSLLRIINDSIEYYDDIVCLQAGYYRLMDNRNESKQSIRIVPNPANSSIEIFSLNVSDVEGIINIYNAIGVCIYQAPTDIGVKLKQLDTSGFKPGIYTINVVMNSYTFTDKLIIIR